MLVSLNKGNGLIGISEKTDVEALVEDLELLTTAFPFPLEAFLRALSLFKLSNISSCIGAAL